MTTVLFCTGHSTSQLLSRLKWPRQLSILGEAPHSFPDPVQALQQLKVRPFAATSEPMLDPAAFTALQRYHT